MDVRDLECFTALADELHFHRAAERLGLAQPALTKRTQKFEAELGVELFVRSKRGVALTDAGRDLLATARSMLGSWRAMRATADDIRQGNRGVVRVAAVGSAFYEALPRLLAPAREQYPDITLKISEMESPELIDALRLGDIDLGFLRPPAPLDLHAHTVWQEPLVAAVPSGSRLSRLSTVPLARLADEQVVFFRREAGPGYWDRVSTLFHDAQAPFAPVESADHVSTILGMVALGSGISVVPASAARLAVPGVAYVPLQGDPHLDLAVAARPAAIGRASHRILSTLPREPLTPSHPLT